MKHPAYIKDADTEGAQEAYTWLTEFYTRYPTGLELAEALYQVRKDLDLIPPEPEPKPRAKRTSKVVPPIDEI
jgi:hypothetical protein